MKVLDSVVFHDWRVMEAFIQGVSKRRGTLTEDQGAGPDFLITAAEADFSASPPVKVGDLFVVTDGSGDRIATTVAELKEDPTTLALTKSLAAEDGWAYEIRAYPIAQADLHDVREEARGCYRLLYFRDDGITEA